MKSGIESAVLTQPFAAVDSLRRALATAPEEPRNSLFVWKSVLIASMLLFSLTASPLAGAAEKNLTPDNLLAIINQDRVQNELSALRVNINLQQAALQKAQDMLQNNYFAHTSPQGLEPWDFIKQAGFDYSFAGENLAINYDNAYELTRDLLESPAHRDNIRSAQFSEVGIAVVNGIYQGQAATIMVQMFARPK